MSYFSVRVGRFVVDVWPDGISFWVYPSDTSIDFYSALLLRLTDSENRIYPPDVDEPLDQMPPPSDTLLSLLRSFAEHRAVYAVVDRLIEEYPETEPYLAGVTANATESVSNGVGATTSEVTA